MQWFVKFGVLVSFLAIGLSGCDRNSNNGSGVGGVGKPVYQKDVSPGDQAEFLAAMDQVQVVLGQTQQNDAQLAAIVADVKSLGKFGETADLSGATTRSTLMDYTQMLGQASADCEPRRKTERDPNGRVRTVSLWNDKKDGSTQDCLLKMSGGQRDAVSRINGNEKVSGETAAQSDHTLYVGIPNKSSLQGKDVAELSRRRSQQSLVKPGVQFRYPDIETSTAKTTYNFKSADASSTTFEFSETSNLTKIAIDDSKIRTAGTKQIVFVYHGTKNPIVYERTETWPSDGKHTTVITINGVEVFREPK